MYFLRVIHLHQYQWPNHQYRQRLKIKEIKIDEYQDRSQYLININFI